MQLTKLHAAAKKSGAENAGCIEGTTAEDVEDEKPKCNDRRANHASDNTLTIYLEISDEREAMAGALVVLT